MKRKTTDTVAVTGATGFVGRHAVAELLRRGHHVRALVRDRGRASLPAGVELVEGAIGNRDAIAALAAGATALIHAAGIVSASRDADYFRVNADPLPAIAAAATAAGVSRMVHVSSLAAREPSISAYAASKRRAEELLAPLADRLSLIMLRPPAIYGPGDRATLPLLRELTRPIALIPGRRRARFSLLHVGDFARLLADQATGGPQGIHEADDGREGGYGWDDVIAMAAAAEGRPRHALFLPRPVVAAAGWTALTWSRLSGRPNMVNPGKVRELYHPDWLCRTPRLVPERAIEFDRGFADTLAWYRQEGWLPPRRRTDRSRTHATPRAET
jgi:nucleoside-diphosphate-sugar epimerase